MEIITLSHILLALSIVHGLHSVFEPVNIRNRVKRLEAKIHKKPFKEKLMNVDTRLKAFIMAFVGVFVTFLLAFFVVSLSEVETSTSIWTSMIIIFSLEIINTVSIDKYHVEIEKVTKVIKEDK